MRFGRELMRPPLQIVEYIEEVCDSDQAFLVVKLDLPLIRELMLEIDTPTVIAAILATPSLKIKDPVR